MVSLLAAPSAYTAFAQVLVVATGSQEQTNQVTSRQRESLNLDTEAQIVQSTVVAKKAEKVLRSIPGPVEVSVPPNTSVLQISYTADDPAAAAAGANAYARAYLAYRSESFTGALAAQLKVLLAKLKQVNASLAKVAATLPGLAKGTAEQTIALQQQSVLSRQSYTLTTRYNAFRTVAVIPGSVISDAVAPTEPSAPSPPLYLGGGLMAGLLSGVGAAWLRDRLGTRLRRKPRVRRPTGTGTAGGEEPDGPAGAATMPGAVLTRGDTCRPQSARARNPGARHPDHQPRQDPRHPSPPGARQDPRHPSPPRAGQNPGRFSPARAGQNPGRPSPARAGQNPGRRLPGTRQNPGLLSLSGGGPAPGHPSPPGGRRSGPWSRVALHRSEGPRRPVRARLPQGDSSAGAAVGGLADDSPVVTGPHRAAWPIAALLLGYPVWWALGFGGLSVIVLAVPMARSSCGGARPIRAPRGFGLWLLLLAGYLVSALMLAEMPPGTYGELGPPAGSSATSCAWRSTLSLMIMVLYLGNLTERELPQLRLVRMLGVLFITTVAGGLLGVFAPRLLLHLAGGAGPAELDRRQLLRPEPDPPHRGADPEGARPRLAPAGGAVRVGQRVGQQRLGAAHLVRGRLVGVRRPPAQALAAVPLIALAAVPIVYSLNRGLWIGLGLACVLPVRPRGRADPHRGSAPPSPPGRWCSRSARSARWWPSGWTARTATTSAPSPCRRPIGRRPHSPRHRLTATPATRTGNHRTITTGKTDWCPGCGHPPLGSDGQLWLLMITQGFAGRGPLRGLLRRRDPPPLARPEPDRHGRGAGDDPRAALHVHLRRAGHAAQPVPHLLRAAVEKLDDEQGGTGSQTPRCGIRHATRVGGDPGADRSPLPLT